ncbi:MAG: homocysteine S-methyltransferase family protein [Endomicrobium sp.]|jgi:5-methyltetrahydrofolate--homocysteine methyltransferase|nr:homocysteine S-methyltransferase family protein [Endomicrobium sp.]
MDKKTFLNIISSRVLLMDGATGTELQRKKYLDNVKIPEELNIKFPEKIKEIYNSYIQAGSNIILANTFGLNPMKLKESNLLEKADAIFEAGISIIRTLSSDVIVAGDISSLGVYIEPLGTLSFNEAYKSFSFQASLLNKYGVDIIVIETITEIKELKAAILATKDNFDGPIIAQMTFLQDGTTVTGTDLQSFIVMAESLGVDVLGLNCSIGSRDLAKLIKFVCANTNLPISFKPNAGMPILINNETIFPESKNEFVESSLKAYSYGVNILGGCCGTTPDFILELSKRLKNKRPIIRNNKSKYFLSTRTLSFDISSLKKPIFVGERINPTNRKKLQLELSQNNLSSIIYEARTQVKSGAQVLDVNVGVPNIDEVKLLKNAVNKIQEMVSVPICIDSSNILALEEAMKNCAGKPIINSVNGDISKLNTILPLIKRYGAMVIALTTDEHGIPKTSEERLQIAGNIIKLVDKYKINRHNVIFDYLVLAISASKTQALETLHAMKLSKQLYPECSLILGISNISFGLPSRQILNSTFLKMAIESGLDFAILDPYTDWSIDNILARNLLLNKSENAILQYMQSFNKQHVEYNLAKTNGSKHLSPNTQLYNAIIYGDDDGIIDLIQQIITNNSGDCNHFQKISSCIINALNVVGERFASRQYFLPQIIMSAKVAQLAFATVKNILKKDTILSLGTIIIATVKGDIHDIGKNIVGAVFESYGFDVIDMGINVDPYSIIKKAKQINPIAIGLSALMTTTMPEMKTVIHLRNLSQIKTKVIIGGAAVTKQYSIDIGADAYAKDAMEAVIHIKSFMKIPKK